MAGFAASVLRLERRECVIAAIAALLALLTSPITAVWSVAVALPLILVGWLLSRTGFPAARSMMAVGLGLAVGALPYFLLALVL